MATIRLKTVTALYLVVAILFILAVATQVFVTEFLDPSSLFQYTVFMTIISGIISSIIIEQMDVKILK